MELNSDIKGISYYKSDNQKFKKIYMFDDIIKPKETN